MKLVRWTFAAALVSGVFACGRSDGPSGRVPQSAAAPPQYRDGRYNGVRPDPQVEAARRYDEAQTWAWQQERESYRQELQAAADEIGRWTELLDEEAERSQEPRRASLIRAKHDLEAQRGELIRDLTLLDNDPIDAWPRTRAEIDQDLHRTRSSLRFAMAQLQEEE